jgi:2-polyprenyl-6-methoxyphenol hydroxylase-like FAD-dependent oxidoreductase
MQRFVIVGGGTAGWLAALMLQDAVKRQKIEATITVVESSKIPTIGVGEGTTAVFRQLLRHFGFDEFEFLRDTEATIKFGIRHKDWRKKNHHYDGPIDDPHLVLGAPNQSWLDIYNVAAGKPVTEPHLFTYLLDQQKSPFAQKEHGGYIAAGPYHHAYHFDQALAGKYLRKKSQGVEIIDAQISTARKNAETGHIEALICNDGREISGDFFVDCTGFRKSLIGQEMGGTWVSYAKQLPVNRAMPFWVDVKAGEEIPPYTLAWAQNSGWLWQIPTQKRFGMGYVYSDEFSTPENAKLEIEAALGHTIEPRNDLKFEVGRLQQSWIKNCLALGLSSSFLEPLEATSIHGTIVQLMVFTTFHLKNLRGHEAYNNAVAQQVDDFKDFINLHYVTERRDTPFWQHVALNCIGQKTKERLALWQIKMPAHADFNPLPGNFAHTEQQLHYPVLDGLGLLNQHVAQVNMAAHIGLKTKASSAAAQLSQEYRNAARQTIGHRAFLESL